MNNTAETNLSREDKVELAKRRLSKLRKKKSKSSSNVSLNAAQSDNSPAAVPSTQPKLLEGDRLATTFTASSEVSASPSLENLSQLSLAGNDQEQETQPEPSSSLFNNNNNNNNNLQQLQPNQKEGLPQIKVEFMTPDKATGNSIAIPEPASPSLIVVSAASSANEPVIPRDPASLTANARNAAASFAKMHSVDQLIKADDKRMSKSMLEHVEYIERLNAALVKENSALNTSVKQMKEKLMMSSNEKLAIERHNASVDSQLAQLKAKGAEQERILADMEDIRAQNLMYQEQMQDLETTNLHLNTDLQSLNGRYAQIQSDFNAKQQELDQLRMGANKEIETLRSQIEQSAANQGSLLAESQAHISSLQSENDQIRKESQAKTEQMMGELLNANNAIDSLKKDYESQRAELEKMESRLHASNGSESERMQQIEEYRSMCEKLQLDMSQLRNEKDALAVDVSDWRSKYAQSETEISRMKNFEQFQVMYESVLAELEARNAECKRITEEKATMEFELAGLRDKSAAFEKEASHLKQELFDTIERSKSSVDSQMQSLNEQLVAFMKENQELKQSIGNTVDGLQKERHDLEQKLAQKEQLFTDISRELSDARSQLADQTQTAAKFAELQQKLDEVVEEKNKLLDQMSSSQTLFQSKAAVVEAKDREIAQLIDEINSLRTKSTELETKLKVIAENNANLEKTLVDIQHLKDENETIIAIKEQELSQLKNSLVNAEANTAALELRLKNLSDENSTLKKEVTASQVLSQSVEDAVAAKELQIAEMSQNTETLSSKVSLLESQLAKVVDEKGELQEKITSIQALNKTAEQIVAAKEQELINMKKSVDMFQAKLRDVQESHSQISVNHQDAEVQIRELNQSLESMKIEKQSHVEALQAEISKLASEKDEIVRQYQNTIDELKKEAMNHQEAETRIRELNQTLDAMKVEKQSQAESLQAEICRISAEKDELVSQYQHDIDELKKEALNHQDAEIRIQELNQLLHSVKIEKQSQVEASQSEINTLAAEKDEIVRQYQNTIEELKKEAEHALQVRQQLENSFHTAQTQLHQVQVAYEEQLSAKNTQINELMQHASDTSALEEIQRSFDKLKSQLQETVEQLNSMKQEHAQSLFDLSQAVTEIDNLKHQLADTKKAKDDAESLVHSLEIDHTRLQKLESFERYYREILEFIDYIHQGTGNFEHSYDNNAIVKLESVLMQLKKHADDLNVESSSVKVRLADLEQTYGKLVLAHTNLQESHQELEHQKQAVEDQLKVLKETMEEEKLFRESAEENLKQIEMSRKTDSDLATKLTKSIMRLDEEKSKVTDLESKVVEWRGKYQILSETLKKEKESAAASVDMLETMLADEKEQNVRLMDQLNQHDGNSTQWSPQKSAPVSPQKLQSEKVELTRLLSTATDDLENALKHQQTLQERHQKLEADFDMLKKDFENAKNLLMSTAVELGVNDFYSDKNTLVEMINRITQEFNKLNSTSSAKLPSSPDSKKTEYLTQIIKELVREANEDTETKKPDPLLEMELKEKLDAANAQISHLTSRIKELTTFYDEQLQIKISSINQLNETIESISLKASQNRIVAAENMIQASMSNPQLFDDQIIQDLQNSVKLKVDEIQLLRDRISEYETALTHAQRTIGTLTGELDSRKLLLDKMRHDMESMRDADKNAIISSQHRAGDQSPNLELKMESAMSKAGETVNVIDELVKLAKKRSNQKQNTAGMMNSSQTESLLLSIQEELRNLPNADEALVKLERIETLLMELAMIGKSNAVPLMNTAERDLLLKLRSEDGKEIDKLRNTIGSMTDHTQNLRSSDSSLSMLKSHIVQLRKVWEHETQANQILRNLLEEMRLRFVSLEQEYRDKNTMSPDHQSLVESLRSDASYLRTEIAALKDKLGMFEQENIRLRNENQSAELHWMSERASLMDQAHQAKSSLVQKVRQASIKNPTTTSSAVPSNWSNLQEIHAKEISDLKKTYRDEKQELLQKFQSKLAEYDKANKTQHMVIVRLKEDKSRMEQEIREISSSDGRTEYNNLQREIQSLRQEQASLNENLRRERGMLADQLHIQRQLLIEKDSQLKDSITNLSQSLWKLEGSTTSLNLANVDPATAQALRRERERHQIHCRRLVTKIFELKIRCKREAGYRADLIYQKNYLLVLMGGLENCERMALSLVQRMGVMSMSLPFAQMMQYRRKRSFKRAASSILFIVRVRLILTRWRRYTLELDTVSISPFQKQQQPLQPRSITVPEYGSTNSVGV